MQFVKLQVYFKNKNKQIIKCVYFLMTNLCWVCDWANDDDSDGDDE